MKRTGIIVMSFAFLASVLTAQVYLGGRGRLTGLVMDQKGQPIDGVTVKLFAVKHQDGFTVNAKNVKVITQDGVVTLRGPVASTEEKNQIAAITADAAGVKRVDNQLEFESGR